MMKYMLILLCCFVLHINAAAASSEGEKAAVIKKCCSFTKVAAAEDAVQLPTVTTFSVKVTEVKTNFFRKSRNTNEYPVLLAVWLQVHERESGALLAVDKHHALQAGVVSRINAMLKPDQFKHGIEVKQLDSLLAQRPLLDTRGKQLRELSIALLIGGSYIYEKCCLYTDTGKAMVEAPVVRSFSELRNPLVQVPQSDYGSSCPRLYIDTKEWCNHCILPD